MPNLATQQSTVLTSSKVEWTDNMAHYEKLGCFEFHARESFSSHLCVVFQSTLFSVFGNVMKTLSQMFDMLHIHMQTNKYIFLLFKHSVPQVANKLTSFLQTLNTRTSIKAANGQSVEAKIVFARSIKFLKEEALKVICTNTGDAYFSASDVQWVLTVPAIWTPRAKQFMREAAYAVSFCKTGIDHSETEKNYVQLLVIKQI